ncbi:hypothetical protein [Oceanospirillum sediminis]|uniref:Uncharacterized protein n=1 Tax=Oceanospirillum sediminis TaxID=2760088 RepID=A0A839IRQ6_9GAMM|nr:hypothetical protein [Oceanospirillum sediminis]MBB1487354.1 hypothetical protein [Oceanospirillum sediminis]
MLINISNILSVKKHETNGYIQWVCFTSDPVSLSNKRPLWKKATGLMSAIDIMSWLKSEYPESNLSEKFSELTLSA